MGYIYIHTNKINGKKYIGQTTQRPKQRWGNEGKNYSTQTHFYKAIQKYSWDNFEHEVRRCPACLLDVMERNLIKFYDTMNPEKGYNHESGGHTNKYLSEETKRKIAEAHTGQKHSEETKKKMSSTHVGEKHTPEWNRRQSEVHKGKATGDNLKRKNTFQSRAEEYKQYKLNDGYLKWNEYQKQIKERRNGRND